ncbi:MAG: hypothetical protein IJM87_05515 [Ruminococcus sp.]|nr:hypothetical protein [Ruminococcus sp.]
MKRLLSFICVFILLLTAVPNPKAYASDNNLYVEIYVAKSFIRKNGVPGFYNTMNNSFNTVKNVYSNTANIDITFHFSFSDIITTAADECEYLDGNDYFGFCECSTNYFCSHDYNHHHTYIGTISNQIPTPNTEVKSTMLLTASHLCKHNSSNVHGYVNGVSYYNICKALVSHVANSNGTSMLVMDIIHEIGHFYGVQDHYTGSNTGNPYCIWGTNRQTDYVLNNNCICYSCKQTLQTNNNRFNQTG